MFGANLSFLFILLSSLLNKGTSCSITTEISPPRVSITSSHVQLHCIHNGTLDFVSFYLPDASTLTTSRQRYEIVERSLDVVLIIRNIEAADAGEYQCNFEDTHGTECFSTIQFEPEETVQFCTENDITYHAYVGDSVTLECCVNNYESQSWRDRDSNDVISENDHITYEGTHLVINPVTLEHRGDYSCTAEKDNNYVTIMASLEVYIPVSVTIDPPQTVLNASDMAELTCTAHSFPPSDIVWAREVSMGLQLQSGVVEKREERINSTTIQSTLTVYNVTEEDTGTYHCTAENVNGSLSVTASLQLFGTPSAPLNVLLSVVNHTSIRVSWESPEDDGHLPLLEYSVMWFRVESLELSDLQSEAVDAATTHYVITDLLPVTNYTVTIYAVNSKGKGMGSSEKRIMTEATVPGPLLELLVVTDHLTASSVRLNYTLSNITGGAPVTGLRIIHRAGDEERETIVVPINTPPPPPHHRMMSYVLDDLKGNTPYSVRASVGNKVGFGAELEASFTTLRPGYPATPTSVRASEVGATRVKLSWEVMMDIGRPYSEYSIRAIENGTQLEGQEYRVKTEDVGREGDRESVEIPSLKPETCYVFTVTIENTKGPGFTSLPSDLACTLSCNVGICSKVEGVQEKGESSGPSSAQLIPILIVTVVVAIIVLLVVILVTVLSRRYSRNKSELNIVSSTNQGYATSSLNSSHLESNITQSNSSLSYHRQHSLVSQNSSSVIDPEETPVTGSSIVSENPFYFGTVPQYQSGSPQYQNRPQQYQNGTIHSVSSFSGLPTEYPQQMPGVRSYPLFPIPEHNVALHHLPPVVPSRSHDPGDTDNTYMTDNPAFEKTPDPHREEGTQPPIPPYNGDSCSDTDSSLPAPDIHVHPHFHNQHCHARIPPHSQSVQSVPFLGESFSQASRSPAMPRPPEFILPDGGELEEEEEEEEEEGDGEEEEEGEGEVEFMDNSAYEGVSPQPQRRGFSSQTTSTSFTSEPEPDEPSYYNMKPSTHSRGQSSSPVFPQRRVSEQSTASGSEPRFEIARQQERGLVFETVTIKSRV